MEATVPEEKLGLGVKLGFYVFVSWIGLLVFAFVLSTLGYLIGAAGSVFGAALAANGLATRVFERLPVTAVGLGWHAGSGRNLLLGAGLGASSAALVTLLPALLGMAELVREETAMPTLGTFLFVSLTLLFGAIGEELLFRGYGFQVVVRLVGPTGALVATGMLFGYVHLQNLNATPLGIANTAGFGVVLGYAFLRTGELWLPIGIHFGWNWMLPLAGVPVSGFKIGMTGYELRWKVDKIYSGGEYGPEAGVLACFVIVLLLLLLRRMRLTRVEPALLVPPRQEA